MLPAGTPNSFSRLSKYSLKVVLETAARDRLIFSQERTVISLLRFKKLLMKSFPGKVILKLFDGSVLGI